jgi:hypothetical protein
MSHVLVEGLPGLRESVGGLSLLTHGLLSVIRSPRFIARLSLESHCAAWLVERPPVQISLATWNLPRRIQVSGLDLWTSEANDILAELSQTEDGAALVTARHADTGRQVWQYFIPIPEPADWAEPSPAWPGAQSEEIYAFFVSDPTRLIVCLSRESRTSRYFSPTIRVDTVPPYGCQTDAVRLDPSSGVPVWHASFQGVYVGIIERRSFVGIWSRNQRVGMLDLEAGTNRVLHEYPDALGWPVHDGPLVVVPWHSKSQVGVSWLDERGGQMREAAWREPRVSKVRLHQTDAGLAMQANDQTLVWLGKEDGPVWQVNAKPYIYHVYCQCATDVFVGTDGRGGRLLAFDPDSGEETLNLKPLQGGAGTLAKIPGHEVLVAKFWTSRKDSVAGDLLVLSMQDRSHRLDGECRELLGTWSHGAICVGGLNGDELAIVDVR